MKSIMKAAQFHQSSSPQRIRSHNTVAPRRGALLIESLLAILILTFCTMSAVSYTLIALKLQALQAAAAAGARQAALSGLTVSQEDAARAVMQPVCDAHGIDLTAATLTFSSPASPPGTLVLEVEIGLNAAGVPDWLGTFGLSWSSNKYNVKALSTVE